MKIIILTAVGLLVLQHGATWPTPQDFNITEISKSQRSTITLSCPSGTFIKKILWSASNWLSTGIEIHCYLPRSLTPVARFRSHGSGALTSSQDCVAVRSFNVLTFPELNNAVYDIFPHCNLRKSDSYRSCGETNAYYQLSIDIDPSTNLVSNFRGGCRNVGDIAALCAAHDRRRNLFTCSAEHSLYPLRCSHAKKIGYGKTTDWTDELLKEFTFYLEFGFSIGFAGPILSANFHTNLGYSATTGYSWSETQESSFQEETTVTVEAEAPAGCITTVVEIIGECSFMQVRPNYFRREDVCGNVSFLTDVIIPTNFDATQIFRSEIPDQVMDFLESTETRASKNEIN